MPEETIRNVKLDLLSSQELHFSLNWAVSPGFQNMETIL